jgi:hypothetical protein
MMNPVKDYGLKKVYIIHRVVEHFNRNLTAGSGYGAATCH